MAEDVQRQQNVLADPAVAAMLDRSAQPNSGVGG